MLRRWINIERLTHSVKTVIAVAIGILLTTLLSIKGSQWIVITIIVVMCAQIYVGSVLQKAFLRFLGTLIGCLFATITIVLIGDTHLSVLITICLSSFIFSYVSSGENLSYTSTLGAVTTAIIMLGQTPTIALAGERFLEISIGLLIATLVSQFVLPIHARTHLRRAQAATLEQLQDYYKIVMMDNGKPTVDYHDLEEPIVLSLLKQRQLAKESKREPLGLEFNQEHFMQSLYCEREILRAITFMQSASTHINKSTFNFFQQPALIAFNKMVVNALSTLMKVIDDQKPGDEPIYITGVAELKEAIERNINISPREELLYIDGLLFSAESLADSLKKLAVLYRVPLRTD